ncbi:MAG: hypothetical protein H8E20_14920 [Verrucomicrobia bacterium]|nr:hypothetical protein [Verrucomicrobiota bacterium]
MAITGKRSSKAKRLAKRRQRPFARREECGFVLRMASATLSAHSLGQGKPPAF